MNERFFNAWLNILITEGGYVNDPDDPGGMTIFGISRKYHPECSFWKSLEDGVSREIAADDAKKLLNDVDEIKRVLESSADPRLAAHALVASYEIYYTSYWRSSGCNQIASARVAEEVFEATVNTGKGVQFLQEALNLLNDNVTNGDLWPELKVDNSYGPNTNAALTTAFVHYKDSVIWMAQNFIQGRYYMEVAENRPALRKFLRGWLKRAF